LSEHLTVSEFARRVPCDEKRVRRAVEKGLLHKGADGLLDASQLGVPIRRQNRRTAGRAAPELSEEVRTISDKAAGSDKSAAVIVVREDETPEEAVGGTDAGPEGENWPRILLSADRHAGRHPRVCQRCGLVGSSSAGGG
jgi:hypothetical protein